MRYLRLADSGASGGNSPIEHKIDLFFTTNHSFYNELFQHLEMNWKHLVDIRYPTFVNKLIISELSSVLCCLLFTHFYSKRTVLNVRIHSNITLFKYPHTVDLRSFGINGDLGQLDN